MGKHLLEVNHLQTVFQTRDHLVRAVDDMTFVLDEGEIVSIVGESGSGKSVSMLSILQLIQMPPGKILGGEAIFQGQDLLKLSPQWGRDPKGPRREDLDDLPRAHDFSQSCADCRGSDR